MDSAPISIRSLKILFFSLVGGNCFVFCFFSGWLLVELFCFL